MTIVGRATIAWIIFLTTWWTSAVWVAKAKIKAPIARRVAYFTGFAIGFVALFSSANMVRSIDALWSATRSTPRSSRQAGPMR